MHPKDAHMAVLAVVTELEKLDLAPTPEQRTQPTKRHIAEKLPRMSARELEVTLKNLSRKDRSAPVKIVTRIKVNYCCKPVAVYGLYTADLPKTMTQWHASMSLWAGLSETPTTA